MMLFPKLAFVCSLLLASAEASEPEEPCGDNQQTGTQHLVEDLHTLVEVSEGPCQSIRAEIEETTRLIEETEEDLSAARLENQFWSQQANAFIAGQKAIIEKNFGENLLATTALISTEMVLDALAVTKAAKGAQYGKKALSQSGIVRTQMLKKFRQEFQEALAAEALAKGQAILNGIQDDSWSWWELIPFVSPIKKLNRMAGTDDAVADLGAAQRKASEQSAKAYIRTIEAKAALKELSERLASLNQELGRCLAESGS